MPRSIYTGSNSTSGFRLFDGGHSSCRDVGIVVYFGMMKVLLCSHSLDLHYTDISHEKAYKNFVLF